MSLLHLLCSSSLEADQLDESSLVHSTSGEITAQEQELLKAYHHSFDDEKVDLDLIMHLLFNICQSSDEGEGTDKNLGWVVLVKTAHVPHTLPGTPKLQ